MNEDVDMDQEDLSEQEGTETSISNTHIEAPLATKYLEPAGSARTDTSVAPLVPVAILQVPAAAEESNYYSDEVDFHAEAPAVQDPFDDDDDSEVKKPAYQSPRIKIRIAPNSVENVAEKVSTSRSAVKSASSSTKKKVAPASTTENVPQAATKKNVLQALVPQKNMPQAPPRKNLPLPPTKRNIPQVLARMLQHRKPLL
jgi:hypothetical protein